MSDDKSFDRFNAFVVDQCAKKGALYAAAPTWQLACDFAASEVQRDREDADAIRAQAWRDALDEVIIMAVSNEQQDQNRHWKDAHKHLIAHATELRDSVKAARPAVDVRGAGAGAGEVLLGRSRRQCAVHITRRNGDVACPSCNRPPGWRTENMTTSTLQITDGMRKAAIAGEVERFVRATMHAVLTQAEPAQPSEPAKWTKVTNFDGEEELHSNPGGPVWDAAKASDKHACSKCGHGDHEDMCHILCDTCKASSEPAGEVTTPALDELYDKHTDRFPFKRDVLEAAQKDIDRATAADKATIAELRAELERTKKWRDDCEESMCQLAEEKVEVESERDAARAELEQVKADLDRATDEGIEAERRLSDVADALHCKALIDVMIATARDMREKHDRRWMLLRRLCLAAQHDHDDGRTQDKLRRIFDQMFIQELAAELATDHEQPAAADGEGRD